MDRSEPSLIPGWLKAAAGSGVPHLSQPVLFQDDGGSPFPPRHRSSQQSPAVGGAHVEYESSRTSERLAFPSSRRGPSNNNSSVDRAGADRDNFPHGRSYSVLTRNSSIGSHGTPERDRDGFRGDGLRSDRDWDREGDRDLRSRERDRSLGFGGDEREWERVENGLLRLSIPGASGKYDVDTLPRRSQSIGLSLRISDNGMRKLNEAVSTPSAVPSSSGGLPTTMHKTAFERNFPSLGADEKQGVRPMSPGNVSIASPRPLWQGSSRPDVGRVSSPGLTGSFGGSVSTMSSTGADLWSSALAEAPSLNGNGQSYGLAVNSTAGLMSPASPGPGSAASLNMAEALIQNPPRVRTPPQLSMESQRLEELALKQSRQLIPMTPSLPKAMSLADKVKSKPNRTGDVVTSSSKGAQLSGSSQLNSQHRSSTFARPDALKVSQGKLLVLKSSKDGGTTVSSITKADGSTAPQAGSHGTFGISASVITGAVPATGAAAQCKQSLDRRAPLLSGPAGQDGLAVVRAKDLAHMGDDKRPSLQNRSDFFNALRKKASGNGRVSSNKSDSLPQPKSDVMNLREAIMPADPVDHGSEVKENGVAHTSDCMRFLSEIHSNGDVEHTPKSGMNADGPGSLAKVSSAVDSLDGNSVDSPLPGDSEEEEAAFMRSLGWEENAEGSELTEEEINAFYQMRERQNLLHSDSGHRFRNLGSSEHRGGSLRSVSLGLSSSDSESDDVLHS